MKFLQDILQIQELAIQEETQEKTQLEQQLANMKRPFGFISAYYVQEKVLRGGFAADPNKRLE